MDKYLQDEIADLIHAHYEGVNALVRAVLEDAGANLEALEFDLEMGQESQQVQNARRVVQAVFGGTDPYHAPSFALMVIQPLENTLTKRVPNRAMRHVPSFQHRTICESCGATFSNETYTWSEPPCSEVLW